MVRVLVSSGSFLWRYWVSTRVRATTADLVSVLEEERISCPQTQQIRLALPAECTHKAGRSAPRAFHERLYGEA